MFGKPKYRLTHISKRIGHHTLYQIVALRDLGLDVHKGELGGFIEKHENLSHRGRCWVGRGAMVFGDARVSGGARVELLHGSGELWVYDAALVCGRAQVRGFTSQRACICGNAVIEGRACVIDSNISDYAKVGDRATVINSTLSDYAQASGHARLDNCKLFDCAIACGRGRRHAIIRDGVRLGGNTVIRDREITLAEQQRDPNLRHFLKDPDILVATK